MIKFRIRATERKQVVSLSLWATPYGSMGRQVGLLQLTVNEWKAFRHLLLTKDLRCPIRELKGLVEDLLPTRYDKNGACLYCGEDEDEPHDEACAVLEEEERLSILDDLLDGSRLLEVEDDTGL